DDDVILEIAHHLQFIFFPAQNRFLDQNFMNRRQVKTASENLHQLFAVVNDGRMMTGKPILPANSMPSRRLFTSADLGTSRPIRVIASLNSRRSSAIL